MTGKLAGDAVVEHRERCSAERLGHEQILIETYILRGPVTPVVAESDSLLDRTDAVLPEYLAEVG